MDIIIAIHLINSSIFTYEISDNEILIWEDKIFAVGKDFVYINDDKLTDKGKIHYFKDYGIEWFTDREECKRYAESELE